MNEKIKGLIDVIAPMLHEGRKIDAANEVIKLSKKETVVREIDDADKILLAVLYDLLDNEEYELAAYMLWTKDMFSPDPGYARRVWRALRTKQMVMLMGAASTSKSYSTGVFYLLDWIRDPKYTTVKIIGPSKQHLEDNLFSHIVNLHQTATLPLPGKIGELFIGLNTRNRRGSITGVIVPHGKKGAGKIQGVKRFQRSGGAHPKFGILSRTRILMDEAEKVPVGIWKDVDNITSTMGDDQGSIVACAFNPEDPSSRTGQNSEPEKGWAKIDPDKDHEWTSKFGWYVVRLDGERCENVRKGKVVFPGLQTAEGLEKLKKSSGGSESAGYYTFGRALYPKSGSAFSIIPPAYLTNFKARVIFMDKPVRVLGGDIALEGSDRAIAASGFFGLASGYELPPTPARPDGKVFYFTDETGLARPRYALYIDNLFRIPNGKTKAVAANIKKMAQLLGIQPQYIMLDRTGNGAGVHDTLQEDWSADVMGVNYSEGATELKVFEEDNEVAKDRYDRIQSELWFALKEWMESGHVFLSPDVETEKLYPQLTNRQYKPGLKSKVEAKKDYMNRCSAESPNEADAVTLVLHGVRVRFGIVLSRIKETVDSDSVADALARELDAYVGSTDQWDDLDA